MSEQSNIYTKLWSPETLKVRPCSRLFSLEPIGIGTSVTESLSSYLCRLADEHCVSLQKLITQEISCLITNNQRKQDSASQNISSIFGNSDAKPAINGMRDMTRSLVEALEQLTLRQDLRYLSCLTYKEVIKKRGLFRQHKAWCPQCFEQWEQKKPIYEPLLWSFKDANYCLHHNCQLSDRCPYCNSTQKAIANNSRLGYCDKCQQWLGKKRHTNSLSSENVRENYLIAKGIGELIVCTPQLKFQPRLKNLKQKLKLILFGFERAVHRDLGQYVVLIKLIEKLKIDLQQNYTKAVDLTKIIIPVCDRAKISVSQLMIDNRETLAEELGRNIETDYEIF